MHTNIAITRYKSSRIKVGLLGGSFNPAHIGHVSISTAIRNKLGLDQIWWLVSKQNPLKSASDNFTERLLSAEKIAKPCYIKVTDIEMQLGTIYTVDTIKRLITMFPQIEFFWLMGEDNLRQIPKWRKWREIFAILPIVAYNRGSASGNIGALQAAYVYRHARLNSDAPAWRMLRGRKYDVASSRLR